MKLSEIKKGYLKTYLFNSISFIIAILIWTSIHELMHALGLIYFGEPFEFGLNGIIPHVKFDPSKLNYIEYLITATLPYALDISILVIGFVSLYKKKNIQKMLWVLFTIVFLDVMINMITIPFALISDTSNDFLNLIRINQINILFTLEILLLTILLYIPLYKKYLIKEKILLFFKKLKNAK